MAKPKTKRRTVSSKAKKAAKQTIAL